jgi:hypothetical protein
MDKPLSVNDEAAASRGEALIDAEKLRGMTHQQLGELQLNVAQNVEILEEQLLTARASADRCAHGMTAAQIGARLEDRRCELLLIDEEVARRAALLHEPWRRAPAPGEEGGPDADEEDQGSIWGVLKAHRTERRPPASPVLDEAKLTRLKEIVRGYLACCFSVAAVDEATIDQYIAVNLRGVDPEHHARELQAATERTREARAQKEKGSV